jgi:hypothetical protein
LLALLVGGLVLYGVVAVTSPWAFHIGGRPTPLLTWFGSGKLLTKSGDRYTIFLFLYPSSHFSRLHLDGLRPTGGLQGSGCLCEPSGRIQQLKIGGTIYGEWRSTEHSLMAFRLLEPTVVDIGQKRAGYFDLTGRWNGPDLVMDARGSYSAPFRSGVRIEGASVTLHWDPFWSCKDACGRAANP